MRELTRREIIGTGLVGAIGAAGVGGAFAGLASAPPQTSQIEPEASPSPSRPRIPIDSLPEPDPEQRYVQLITVGDGVLYGLQANGGLAWLRHLGWRDGTSSWANDGVPRIIDSDWLRFRWVLPGDDGQLFGVTSDGAVTWHRYEVTNPETGEGRWAERSGTVILDRLGPYGHIFGGRDGVIFGVRFGQWTLHWHRYLAGDGTSGAHAWSNGARATDAGPANADKPFVDSNATIYEIFNNKLWWRRYTLEGDTLVWSERAAPAPLPGKWHDLRCYLAMGDRVLYTVDNARGPVPVRAGELTWQRMDGPETTPAAFAEANWVQSKRAVGSGFTIEPLAALQGYPLKLSVPSGGALELAISTGYREFTMSVVRLAGGTQPAETVLAPMSAAGRLQHLPPDYRSHGCGWSADHIVALRPDWKSGMYAARLEGEGGQRFDIPFVIRPAQPTAKIAYLWPTNTYLAYNNWGGHSQYTPGLQYRTRTFSYLRPSVFNNIDARPDAKLAGDLILLRWLADEKIAFDCYADSDLHASGAWLHGYRALLLGVHPEYWSEPMRANLLSYLESGGRLIYLGGNGLYERVRVSADGSALTFRRPNGQRDLWRLTGRPETELLGVAYHHPAYPTQAPYRVVRDHFLLAGTGLTVGSIFGQDGVLGAASGWEVDRRGLAGGAAAGEVIAVGQNEAGGAEMLLRQGPRGGWVFSASSIGFVGAIPREAAVRRLVRNVFDHALAP